MRHEPVHAAFFYDMSNRVEHQNGTNWSLKSGRLVFFCDQPGLWQTQALIRTKKKRKKMKKRRKRSEEEEEKKKKRRRRRREEVVLLLGLN